MAISMLATYNCVQRVNFKETSAFFFVYRETNIPHFNFPDTKNIQNAATGGIFSGGVHSRGGPPLVNSNEN